MDKSDMDISEDWHIVSAEMEDVKKEDVGPSNESENQKASVGSQVEEVLDAENVLANDSSSDIDIIEENLDEIDVSPERMFIPSSLSISSSVGKISESSADELASTPSYTATTVPPQSEDSEHAQTEDLSHQEGENNSFMTWRFGGRNVEDWIGLAWEHVQSLSGFQIGCLFGLTFCIYFCFTINQTNIIALQEKGNVVAQMEKLVDELRHDNKHLQEKMLSEMKNDKLVSSFEHQIRELKKENSKLNHMLHDVVKVLEQQKDTQEKLLVKRESEYQAPFKKEIDKLKEHINMLKIDNEELQKQLVRIRYSSYSQGSKQESGKEDKEHKKPKGEKGPETKPEGVTPEKESKKEPEKDKEKRQELPLDIHQLKRWNELLDQFIRENNLFDDEGSETKKKGKWNWRELKNKFKGSAEFVSDFAHLFDSKLYEKMFKDAYRSASDYIADAQENVQSLFESYQDPSAENPDRKSNIWGIINGLGKKWGQVKQKIIMTYGFNEKECPAGRVDPASDVGNKPEPSAESADKSKEYQMPEDPHRKSPKNVIQNANEKWFFKRAQLREKLRDTEKESSKNWFLRRRGLFSEGVDDAERAADRNEREEF